MSSNYPSEVLYIAGPECFYDNGYEFWWKMRKSAEHKGITVAMPTATPLKLEAVDLRENAHEIFDDLLIQAGKTTAIIADLEAFRSCEPDGGTVFELGMLYAKGARLYGYSNRLCPIVEKNPAANYVNGELYDEKGNLYPYKDLPFAPSITATTRLMEGNFDNALSLYIEDLRWIAMLNSDSVSKRENTTVNGRVFISSFERYSSDSESIREKLAQALGNRGFEAVFPKRADYVSVASMKEIVEENLGLLSSSEYFIADLNDFRGYEPSSDVSFESGFAFAKGKKMLGFMADTRCMRERIPNIEGFDAQHHIVENFNYPINLMFSCSIKDIFRATITDYDKIAERLLI